MDIKNQFRNRINVKSMDYDYLLDDAKSFILGYTRRNEKQWLDIFNAIQVKIAVIEYNRLGAEGYKSQSIDSISYTFYGEQEYPTSIISLLNPYRFIKVVGYNPKT